jgi:hypothetical protein
MGAETLSGAIDRLRGRMTTEEGKELVSFFQNGSQRGFTTQFVRRGKSPAVVEEEPGFD